MTEVQQGLTPPVHFRDVSLRRELSVYAVGCARNNLHQAYFTAHLCTSLFLFLACSDNTGILFPIPGRGDLGNNHPFGNTVKTFLGLTSSVLCSYSNLDFLKTLLYTLIIHMHLIQVAIFLFKVLELV